jgi:hypothetical protein
MDYQGTQDSVPENITPNALIKQLSDQGPAMNKIHVNQAQKSCFTLQNNTTKGMGET